MTCSGGRITEAVHHLFLAFGPGRGVRCAVRPPGGWITSWGRRVAGRVSKTQATVAMRFRLGFSPGARRPRRPAAALWAALRRVASRRASGLMTMPLPSAWITSGMSRVQGTATLAW
jgi:hypothetical protein